MIVICEHCETRFKLDEGRIPPGGARVRCSRCKHAFFLPAPGGDEPDLLDELISQTADQPRPAQQPPEDPGARAPVFEAGAPSVPEPGASADAASAHGEVEASESDWEFSEGVPGEDEADESQEPSFDRLELDDGVPAPPPEASGLELAGSLEVTPRAAAQPAVVQEEPPKGAGPEPRSADEDLMSWAFEEEDAEASGPPDAPTPAPTQTPATASVGLEPLAASLPADLLEAPEGVGRLLEGAGWLATAVFVGLVTVQLLLLAPPAATTARSQQPLGPLVAESLRGRFVENLFVGPLLVVTAKLRNPADAASSLGSVARAVLLDAEGHPIEGSAAALAPAAEREIREQPPEVLAARLAERARTFSARTLAPGERVGVAAVFPAEIVGAHGIALELGPRVALPGKQPGAAAGLEPSEASAGDPEETSVGTRARPAR